MAFRVGITLGDVTGIGPEITLKALAALAAEPGPDFLLIGDPEVLERENRRFRLPLTLTPESGRFQMAPRTTDPLPLDLTPGHPAAALAAIEWLRQGARLCLEGQLAGLVTAPVNKHAICRAGIAFVGQTEFLTQLAGAPETGMMLLAPDDHGRWLRVLLATTHLPLRRVPDAVTPEAVARAIRLARVACAQLGLPSARIGVAGLNPHAGESGQFGSEEQDVIRPVIEQLETEGFDVHGPVPADTLFWQAIQGAYDVVVAMYHDQGLGPLKAIGFDRGVNWTVGLPFVRTSPDHGTAYELAGRDVARPDSMVAAIRLAAQLAASADPARQRRPS